MSNLISFPSGRQSTEMKRRVTQIAESCPCSGNGVHRWLFTAALRLLRLGLSTNHAECLLDQATADCGREMKYDEVESAVRNAAHLIDLPFSPKRLQWPQPNWEQIEAIALGDVSVAEMREQSPIHLDDERNMAEEIVDALFPGNPWLCVGRSAQLFATREREKWRGSLDERALIVPSFMKAQFGTTRDGRQSEHALDNVGDRRFLVVEFDFRELAGEERETPAAPMIKAARESGKSVHDICAALHHHLAGFRPLALVVDSGGKSLHGWFPCWGESEELLERFMRYAVSLAADKATWTKFQFVRLPDGRRDNGKRQQVLYFSPAALEVAR